jgi:hypothetical protein
MAMLLAVVSTEAMDPTRESGAFASAATVTEFSSKRVRGDRSFGEGGIT